MDSLRERIRQEVYEAYQAGIDHNQVPFKYPAMGKSEIQEATERIIAAFEAVLLSDEVVEALLMAVEDDSVLAMALSARKQRGDSVVSEATLKMGREWITAALAAAKGKEDEQEDCGCTRIDYGWYVNDGGIVNDIQCSDEGCPRANKGAEEGSA